MRCVISDFPLKNIETAKVFVIFYNQSNRFDMQGNEPYNYVTNISSYHFVIYTEVSGLLAEPVK